MLGLRKGAAPQTVDLVFSETSVKELSVDEPAKIRMKASAALFVERRGTGRRGAIEGLGDFGANLKSVLADMRSNRGEEAIGRGAGRREKELEGFADDICDGAAPARMNGEHSAAHGIGDKKRDTIGRPYKDADSGGKGDEGVRLKFADERRISFGSNNARAVYLMRLEGAALIDANRAKEGGAVLLDRFLIVSKAISEVQLSKTSLAYAALPR